MQDRSVSIRIRDSKGDLTTLSLDQVVERLVKLREDKGLDMDLSDKVVVKEEAKTEA